jgi:hypothetical protein
LGFTARLAEKWHVHVVTTGDEIGNAIAVCWVKVGGIHYDLPPQFSRTLLGLLSLLLSLFLRAYSCTLARSADLNFVTALAIAAHET